MKNSIPPGTLNLFAALVGFLACILVVGSDQPIVWWTLIPCAVAAGLNLFVGLAVRP